MGQGLKAGLLFACLILSSTRGRGNSKKTDSIHPLTLMTQTPPPLPGLWCGGVKAQTSRSTCWHIRDKTEPAVGLIGSVQDQKGPKTRKRQAIGFRLTASFGPCVGDSSGRHPFIIMADRMEPTCQKRSREDKPRAV